MERKDLAPNWPMRIVMVDFEGDEPEEDLLGNPPIQVGKGAILCAVCG